MKEREEKIKALVNEMTERMIARRRDLQQGAATGWTEFRAASLVAAALWRLGYRVLPGEAAHIVRASGEPDERRRQALIRGAVRPWLEHSRSGGALVVGVFDFHRPGPVAAFRADLDAAAEKDSGGFAAVGLAVAEVLLQIKDELCGTVKFIFQTGGADAAAESGVLDDADYVLSLHAGAPERRQLTLEVEGWQASSRFSAEYFGAEPIAGKGALAAAADAALHILAMPRCGRGSCRVSVGTLCGQLRPSGVDYTAFEAETRGATAAVNGLLYRQALEIARAAAAKQGIEVRITERGGRPDGEAAEAALAARLRPVAERLALLPASADGGQAPLKRVARRGGGAALRIGLNCRAAARVAPREFCEAALPEGAAFVSAALAELLERRKEKRVARLGGRLRFLGAR